jgi:uncharacterized DUF497 family protein
LLVFISRIANQRLHGISFRVAAFALLVVFVDRSEPGIEIVRIVSARKPTDYERSAYPDQFRQPVENQRQNQARL